MVTRGRAIARHCDQARVPQHLGQPSHEEERGRREAADHRKDVVVHAATRSRREPGVERVHLDHEEHGEARSQSS